MEDEYEVEGSDLEGSLEDDYNDDEVSKTNPKSRKLKAKEHKNQLERLKEKDPEFYEFLAENDKELLEFNDEDIEDDDIATDVGSRESEEIDEALDVGAAKTEEKSSQLVTTAVVDSWCRSVREESRIGALRNLMKAFRFACHYGDDDVEDASKKFIIMSSHVFNKIMVFVLSEMDGILRNLFGLPASGGQKQTILDLMKTRKWKNYNHLVKSYLGNTLHVLNQMTDNEMVSFTLRRLKSSTIFLVAFPSLLRKYIKVVLHYWGTGSGSLTVVAFLFLRDLCIRLGSDVFDDCLRGIYKAYVLNCQFINAVKLQHINFLANCVTEILRVDVTAGYLQAFVLIRQLAIILRDAITMKTKESFRKVHEWKYLNCLELWTGAVCALNSETEFRPLAYPLTQVISGTARSVSSVQYFPLKLRCIRMLNRISATTGTYIPVSMLLLDMLEIKELSQVPTKGLGNSVDLRSVLKIGKPMLKTRAFQDACVTSVIEELAEHLSQWSNSLAFLELSFIPLVRMRSFTKTTKVDRFRKDMKELIRQIEATAKATEEKRKSISLRPNDASSVTRAEDGSSPLSQYVAVLHQKAQHRKDAMKESSVVVGEHSSTFGKRISENDKDLDNEANTAEGAEIFSTRWLPSGNAKKDPSMKEAVEKTSKKRKKSKSHESESGSVEDIVEDLVLSSDEDEEIEDKSTNSLINSSKKAKPVDTQSKMNPRQNKRTHRRRPKKAKSSSN